MSLVVALSRSVVYWWGALLLGGHYVRRRLYDAIFREKFVADRLIVGPTLTPPSRSYGVGPSQQNKHAYT